MKPEVLLMACAALTGMNTILLYFNVRSQWINKVRFEWHMKVIQYMQLLDKAGRSSELVYDWYDMMNAIYSYPELWFKKPWSFNIQGMIHNREIWEAVEGTVGREE